LTIPSTPSSATYTFATSVASGSTYNVTVFSQPTGETCTTSNGSGTIGSSNVTATVSCAPIDYIISGTVSDLLSTNSIVLQDNGADPTTVTYPATGFSFTTKIASGSDYNVTVQTQPTGQACTVANGSGTVSGANVSNVVVTCGTNSYSIGGTLSGLAATESVTLQDNSGDNLTLSANGSFTFGTLIPENGAYSVSVLTQPAGQLCSVTHGAGTAAGSDVTNVSVICANTYTVGGTVTGLSSGTLIIKDNLTDSLSITTNGSFTFGTPIAQGAAYSVTVGTQPTGQTCTVSAGSGTMGGANVTNVKIVCEGDWIWMSGAKVEGAAGNYGTKGVIAASNIPGARYSSMTWSANGTLWLFGGAGYASSTNVYYNDLWQYTPTNGWVWMTGLSTTDASGTYSSGTPGNNTPGARSGGVTWVDSSGNLWLFGGYGFDSNGTLGYLNDLWTYTPSVTGGTWTWVGGSDVVNVAGSYGTPGLSSNIPGARSGAVSWTDTSGNFWLFGGAGEAQSGSGFLNDLWRYSPSLGLWTWVTGSSSADAGGNYGTLGTPGARHVASGWVDSNGNLWLFGGQGYDGSSNEGYMNDLWMFSTSVPQWNFVAGSSTVSALANYGTKGVPASTNVPGARGSADSWADASGNLWLFGGSAFNASGAQGNANDLWSYNIASGEWTWVAGSQTLGAEGNYGTKGTAAPTNVPGARYSAVAWIDASGNFWLFGGEGVDGSDNLGVLNDLWEYVP
jgi:hypothetical protein